jgi:TPR repeat protein
MKRFLRIAVFACSAALAAPVMAQDFEMGAAAFNRGDYVTALENFKPLAEQGNAMAQTVLGSMYQNGTGVLQDDVEAVRWYRQAAEQEFALAQISLGVMYQSGKGIEQDSLEAIRWYRRAANQGSDGAQTILGHMYLNADGVEQSNTFAHMWYNVASANGNKDAAMARDKVAADMPREQIADAQARARVCMASNYQDCD